MTKMMIIMMKKRAMTLTSILSRIKLMQIILSKEPYNTLPKKQHQKKLQHLEHLGDLDRLLKEFSQAKFSLSLYKSKLTQIHKSLNLCSEEQSMLAN